MRNIVIIRDLMTPDEIGAIDLSREARHAAQSGEQWEATAVLIDGQRGDLLVLSGQVVGLAWGSDAVWADVVPGETTSETVQRLLAGEGV